MTMVSHKGLPEEQHCTTDRSKESAMQISEGKALQAKRAKVQRP